MKKPIQVRLDKELYAALEAKAKQERRSKAGQAEVILKEHFASGVEFTEDKARLLGEQPTRRR